jgi:tetrahydromethanopterin:alpha-L-glutamate ligase
VKIAIAGVIGKWSTEHLGEALRSRGVETTLFQVRDCLLDLDGGAVRYQGTSLEGFDGVVVKKMGELTHQNFTYRLGVLRQLERNGARVFSPPDQIAVVADRLEVTRTLRWAGLPMSPTVVTQSVDEALSTLARYGTCVLKPIFTTKGRGMKRLEAENRDEAAAELERFRDSGLGPFYLQQFVDARGRDIGISVLDGKVIGTYYRIAGEGNWMTTIHSGGRYEACDLTPELEEIALRAAGAFRLDFTGVDVVQAPDGSLMLYEVSAFGGFKGCQVALDLDAADLYADYIVRTLASG